MASRWILSPLFDTVQTDDSSLRNSRFGTAKRSFDSRYSCVLEEDLPDFSLFRSTPFKEECFIYEAERVLSYFTLSYVS